jgi:hypothetical protein
MNSIPFSEQLLIVSTITHHSTIFYWSELQYFPVGKQNSGATHATTYFIIAYQG